MAWELRSHMPGYSLNKKFFKGAVLNSGSISIQRSRNGKQGAKELRSCDQTQKKKPRSVSWLRRKCFTEGRIISQCLSKMMFVFINQKEIIYGRREIEASKYIQLFSAEFCRKGKQECGSIRRRRRESIQFFDFFFFSLRWKEEQLICVTI